MKHVIIDNPGKELQLKIRFGFLQTNYLMKITPKLQNRRKQEQKLLTFVRTSNKIELYYEHYILTAATDSLFNYFVRNFTF